MEVQFYDDAAAFLTEAGPFLERHPLRHTIVATTAGRLAQSGTEASGPRWFAVVRDGVDLVGVVMRTHPEPPHAGFVPSLPEAAVAAVTAGLAGRGERVSAWNGDLDAARALCAAAAEGAPVQVVLHTRLFELHEVVTPCPHHPIGAKGVGECPPPRFRPGEPCLPRPPPAGTSAAPQRPRPSWSHLPCSVVCLSSKNQVVLARSRKADARSRL